MPNTSADPVGREGRRPTAHGTAGLGTLDVTVVLRARAVVVVRVLGDIDALTVPVLETALLTELDALPELLVVDLGGVTRFGLTGLIALLDVQEAAAAAGRSVRVAGAAPSVRRLFELAGLTRRFTPGVPAVARTAGRHPGSRRR